MKYTGVLILFFLAVNVNAQVMQAKAQWGTIKVPQLKCWECEQRLNQYLTKEKGPNADAGIIQWKTDMRNGILKIQFLPDRITLDFIRTAVANAGFDADSVTAEPDAYKRLPNPCKKVADGSGFGPFKYCNLEPADRPTD
jgi:mercuric ion binding protein